MHYADLYLFLVSMLIGGLIGTERQRRIVEDGLRGVAGLRTFILIALLGTLCAYLARDFGQIFMTASFASFVILVGVGYATASRLLGWLDFTSAVAAVVTFALGAMCISEEQLLLAVSLSILTTLTLATRKTAHRYVESISDAELLDTLKMGIIALVIYPLLPDQTLDPFGVLNPRRIWMMVVLVSLISYVGYFLIKVLGEERGLTLTGFLGGLVSSTAVTMTMASEARSRPEGLASAVFATTVASCTMFPRILLIVLVANAAVFPSLLLQLAAMAATGVVLAFLQSRRRVPVESRVVHKDPFRLFPALKFGALFAGILLLSKLASTYFGDAGIYAASIISGLADVDAIVLSMATLAETSISPELAATAITIAAMTNTMVKLAIAFMMGSPQFGRSMAQVFLPMMAVGLVTLVFL